MHEDYLSRIAALESERDLLRASHESNLTSCNETKFRLERELENARCGAKHTGESDYGETYSTHQLVTFLREYVSTGIAAHRKNELMESARRLEMMHASYIEECPHERERDCVFAFCDQVHMELKRQTVRLAEWQDKYIEAVAEIQRLQKKS